jgi:hypothetical protein
MDEHLFCDTTILEFENRRALLIYDLKNDINSAFFYVENNLSINGK